MAIKMKGNKELFEKIKLLSSKILCEASYVQNDMELTQDDIKEFMRMNEAHTKELGEIREEMLAHVVKCNE